MKTPILQSRPLKPNELEPLAERAVGALLREGESAHTRASYQGALRYWAAWFAMRFDQPLDLPVAPSAVLQFIIDHAEHQSEDGLRTALPAEIDQALVDGGFKARLGPPALATVMHRLAVLSALHEARRAPNPCKDPAVRELIAKTRKAYAKRGHRPNKKAALTREPLEALLATCNDSLRGRRDRALLLFAWASGGRRRSEVSAATIENLRRLGPQAYLYTLTHSKTNQSGDDHPENQKPLVGAAAAALEHWLLASKVKTGPIFRRIRRGDHVAEPLSPSAVRNIVKARCEMAGIEGDFSAHSLRSGFVTEAGIQNASLGDTMAMTDHRSIQTVLGYFRSGQLMDSPIARLMDSNKKSD